MYRGSARVLAVGSFFSNNLYRGSARLENTHLHPVGAGLKKTQRKAFFVSRRVFFCASWWACRLVCVCVFASGVVLYRMHILCMVQHTIMLHIPTLISSKKKLIEHGLIVSILLNNFTVYQTVNIFRLRVHCL